MKAVWLGLGWLLVGAVAVASLLPVSRLPPIQFWDKAEHFVAYGALAFVFAGAVGRTGWRAVLWGLLAFGAALEIGQALAGTGRHADWWDLAADALGIAVGLAVALAIPGGWCRRLERVFEGAREER